MTTMHIRQCPRCELRFTSSSELEYHLSNDHRPRPSNDDDEVAAAAPNPPSASRAESVDELAAAPRPAGSASKVSVRRRLRSIAWARRHRSDDRDHQPT
jgi:hypothetical protein